MDLCNKAVGELCFRKALCDAALRGGLIAVLLPAVSVSGAFGQSPEGEVSTAGPPHERPAASAPSTLRITADPFAPGLLQHAGPVTVVESAELRRRSESTLGETLGLQPGVSSSYFGPGSSRPIIRGSGGERVRILSGGLGAGDVSNTSEDHRTTANPLLAEQIEILRGPETLLFGSSAIGGIVNVVEGSIPEEPVGALLKGRSDLRLGTADDERTAAGLIEGQTGTLNWRLSGFLQETDDVEIPGAAESSRLRELEALEGESGGEHQGESDNDNEHGPEVRGLLENSALRTKNLTAGGSYVSDEVYFGLALSGDFARYGVPGHGHASEDDQHGGSTEEALDSEVQHGEEGGTVIDLEQWKLDLRGRRDFSGSRLRRIRYSGRLSNYDHKELEGGEVGTAFENDSLELRIEADHALRSDLEGVAGAQIDASDFTAEGEEAFVPSTLRWAPAAFAFEEFALTPQWRLQAGGRFELVELDAEGFSSDRFTPIGFSLGISRRPAGKSQYTAGLTAAFTQRAPAASELYADGPHAARQTFEIGDSEIGNEQSWGLDAVVRKTAGVVTGSVSLFLQEYDSYINLAGTGEEAGGLPVFRYEEVRARFWGAEAESTLHLFRLLDILTQELDLSAQADFVRAQNLSDGGELPRIPPFRGIARLDYSYKAAFAMGAEGVFAAEQDRTAPSELPTDSYQLLNGWLEYRIPIDAQGRKAAFYLRGTNLTDQEARLHSSFLKDLAPLRGRSLLFGIKTVF